MICVCTVELFKRINLVHINPSVVHKSTIPEYRPSKSAHESESSTPKSGQSSAKSEVNSDTVQYKGVMLKSFISTYFLYFKKKGQ